MLDDPIVTEVRKAREAHAAKFNNDLRAIYLDLKKKELEYKEKGWKVVSFKPKKLKFKRKATKTTDYKLVATA